MSSSSKLYFRYRTLKHSTTELSITPFLSLYKAVASSLHLNFTDYKENNPAQIMCFLHSFYFHTIIIPRYNFYMSTELIIQTLHSSTTWTPYGAKLNCAIYKTKLKINYNLSQHVNRHGKRPDLYYLENESASLFI